MLNKKTQDLVAVGNGLFSNKSSLDSFLDAIALDYYPERAYVINNYSRTDGAFFANNLTTSFPILTRRTLGEVFSSTRPRHENWFEIITRDYDKLNNESRVWLDYATKTQRSFMYDNMSGFVRAVGEADQDFVTFGQSIVSSEVDWKNKNLIYRCWRIRDITWQQDYAGNVNQVFRKCDIRMMDILNVFGKEKMAQKMLKDMEKDPYGFMQIWHIVMTTEDFKNSYQEIDDDFKTNQPFVSIYLDTKNQHRLEIVGIPTLRYIIPRWMTVAGSQYAYSPSVMTSLPDTNLLQAMTLTILDAGEKAASPPILAREDAVRGDIGLSANAVTVINGNYDGAVDDAIKMMQIDRSGMQFALKLLEDTREMIKDAFYINKINLRQPDGDKTAYEISQIVKENARELLALFQPIEDFNSKLCETTFIELLHAGAFGDPRDIPDQLKGEDVSFKFKNALNEAQGDNKTQLFAQLLAGIAQTSAVEPTAKNMVDVKVAFRDALYSAGTPPKWLRNEDVVAEMDAQQEQAAQAQALIAQLGAGGVAAQEVGKGAQAVQEAGIQL